MRQTDGTRALNGYRFWLESRNLAQNTVIQYESQARQWVKWCEDHDLDFRQATREHITMHLGELRHTALQTTAKIRLISIRIFMDYCLQAGYRRDNPGREIPVRKAQSRPSDPFTPTEVRRMYDACKSYRERAVFLLLLGGGLRRGEVFGIKKADCNFDQGTVTVLGKGSQYRMVAPGKLTMGVLEQALEFDEKLIPYKYDIYIENLVKRLGKQAGVSGRVHPHRFRSHFATSFLDAGGSVEELQQILGHAHVEMSLHYARAGRKRRAIEAQNRIDVAARMLEAG